MQHKFLCTVFTDSLLRIANQMQHAEAVHNTSENEQCNTSAPNKQTETFVEDKSFVEKLSLSRQAGRESGLRKEREREEEPDRDVVCWRGHLLKSSHNSWIYARPFLYCRTNGK